jgi:serine/threonine protein phosphatase PrpC
MIVALGETEKKHLILNDNKQDSFSNYTNSLQQKFKPNQWKTATIESAECNAVVLCTDGISDDLLPETVIDFAKEFVNEYASMKPHKRVFKISNMLKAWPVPGHSDDKTIACLLKKEGSQ